MNGTKEKNILSAPGESVVFPSGEVSICCRTMVKVGWDSIVSVGSLKMIHIVNME